MEGPCSVLIREGTWALGQRTPSRHRAISSLQMKKSDIGESINRKEKNQIKQTITSLFHFFGEASKINLLLPREQIFALFRVHGLPPQCWFLWLLVFVTGDRLVQMKLFLLRRQRPEAFWRQMEALTVTEGPEVVAAIRRVDLKAWGLGLSWGRLARSLLRHWPRAGTWTPRSEMAFRPSLQPPSHRTPWVQGLAIAPQRADDEVVRLLLLTLLARSGRTVNVS